MRFPRTSALAVVLALMLVPAVGRAKQRVDPPNAKPRLSAPFRSVDVKPAPILVVPDTAVDFLVQDETARYVEQPGDDAVPAAPDVRATGSLRGPPRY